MLGAEALVMRLVVNVLSSRPTDRWGEASRAQIDGPPIEHHGKASQAATIEALHGSMAPWPSSSVYLFALEAYSSPIPTASAMGLWSCDWSMVAKGPAAAGNLGHGIAKPEE